MNPKASNKKLLGAKGIATRSSLATSSYLLLVVMHVLLVAMHLATRRKRKGLKVKRFRHEPKLASKNVFKF